MRRKVRVKPSKASSLMGMIVGTVFVLIGLAVVIPNVGAFGVFWTLIAVAITGMNAFNYFSKEGIASMEMDIDSSEVSMSSSDDFAARLRKLTQLRDDGLITEDEFQQKRREILGEKW